MSAVRLSRSKMAVGVARVSEQRAADRLRMVKSASTKLNSFKPAFQRTSSPSNQNPKVVSILQQIHESQNIPPIAPISVHGTFGSEISAVEKLPESCFYDTFDSPVGKITLLGSEYGLHAIALTEADGSDSTKQLEVKGRFRAAKNEPLLQQAKKELEEYFEGNRTTFSVPLAPAGGTAFQQLVWKGLQKIPYGKTLSYSEQAITVGLTEASSRAVGMANGRNPLPIMVPCHRVIGKNGNLTGFMGGVDKKKYLLTLESAL